VHVRSDPTRRAQAVLLDRITTSTVIEYEFPRESHATPWAIDRRGRSFPGIAKVHASPSGVPWNWRRRQRWPAEVTQLFFAETQFLASSTSRAGDGRQRSVSVNPLRRTQGKRAATHAGSPNSPASRWVAARRRAASRRSLHQVDRVDPQAPASATRTSSRGPGQPADVGRKSQSEQSG
jgi:hypothetical protein